MAYARTWARVASKKKPSPFLPTECAVDLEQFAAPQCLPPSSSRYSAFVPLLAAYNSGWAMNITTSIRMSAVGVVPRRDISVLHVCFATAVAQHVFLSAAFTCQRF